jgi:dUTPase
MEDRVDVWRKIDNPRGYPFRHFLIYSPIGCDIRPDDYALIRTGLVPLIPYGFELHIRPRFSLAEKCQVYALPGVIHARTRQEIVVMLVNHSVVPYKVKEGDAIAQISLSPIIPLSCVFTESQSDTFSLSKHCSQEVL